MFTGIVQSTAIVVSMDAHPGFLQYSLELPASLSTHLQVGASISVDGVCQTITKYVGNIVHFDAIEETLNRTTIGQLQIGQHVNIERAAKFGDEIGGHLVSGHVYDKGQITKIEKPNQHNTLLYIQCRKDMMKYILEKGFVAINGCSLTIVRVNESESSFSVSLIPETLSITTFKNKTTGDWVNIEIDSQTQTIVETVERVLKRK